ncbi:rho guanine nucleotide exchange factor 39-like [Diretmus argenteus]
MGRRLLIGMYFVEILKAKGTLRQDVRDNIFSSIKSIHSVNQTLLIHLENGYFGRGFDQFCPQLHHYNSYADNIYNSSKVLGVQMKKNKAFRRFKNECLSVVSGPDEEEQSLQTVQMKKNKAFRRFKNECLSVVSGPDEEEQSLQTVQMKKNKAFRRFKKLQEARPEFKGCKLEDLLQLPVQRIEQYKHFLQDLTENTSPDNPEFQQLSRSRSPAVKLRLNSVDEGSKDDVREWETS